MSRRKRPLAAEERAALESDYGVMCLAIDRAYEAVETGTVNLVAYEAMCQAIAKVYDGDAIERCDDLTFLERLAKNIQPEISSCKVRLHAERELGKLRAEEATP